MPKRDKEAAASKYVFDILDALNESGGTIVLADHELMQAVAQGNVRAFSLLMDRHMTAMTALARRITLNLHDADEVVQEAFLRVWTNAPRWNAKGPAQFKTWLHRIVTNLAIDQCRRQKPLPLEAAGDPPDPARGVEADMQAHDEARLLKEALARLPEKQRAAIVLYYFEDMTAAQIAEILGQRQGATEVMLMRTRRTLRGLLTETRMIEKEDINK